MAPGALSANSLSARATLCRQCLVSRARTTSLTSQKRSISQNVQRRRDLHEEAWRRKAKKIQEGEDYNVWDLLVERGYVKDTAGSSKQIWELLRRKRIGAYVGVDPTAPSLHVGHLLPMMALFWLYMHGYGAVTLVGGSTAKVGDPTDRLKDRDKLRGSDLVMNTTKTHYQLKTIWSNVEGQAKRFKYTKESSWSRAIVNNSAWLHSTPIMEVVGRMFKSMRMGPLLSRDTVRRRLEESGEGMPLDEFIYPLLQGWDWWEMYKSRDVLMQIGGSDQYGNIVTGAEAVKKIRDSEPNLELRLPDTLENTPVGFTVPLLTDSSGAKFGKSAGNAVWLDPFMTSSFDLYGYFMRRPDADVEKLLKVLTFLPLETVKQTMEEHNQDPSKRVAQHALAFEVVALAHSMKLAYITRDQHHDVYSKNAGTTIAASTPRAQEEVTQYPQGNVPAQRDVATNFKVDIELPESLVRGSSMGRILYAAGLATSVSDGVRLTSVRGAYVAGAPGQKSAVNKGMTWGDLTFTPVKNWFPADTSNFLIDNELLIVRRGKHFIRVIKMVSDEKWRTSGRRYPGQPYSGPTRDILDSVKAIRQAGTSMTHRDWSQFKAELANDKKREEALQKSQIYIPSGTPPDKPVSKEETT
ncbi:putative Tyrosine--tRNA ligase [Seiridium cardinale]|uniref:Tyrosine--tRNA ligase n=1 Tax=Seiridium cardinale TaxID=138064 RepID=A0ABR2Y1B7_9PEZI